jgi:hypothetical protein
LLGVEEHGLQRSCVSSHVLHEVGTPGTHTESVRLTFSIGVTFLAISVHGIASTPPDVHGLRMSCMGSVWGSRMMAVVVI